MTTKRQGEWTINTKCSGHGHHSQHLGSFPQSEMAEEGQEFMEDYMAGHYDKVCERCRGSGKLWYDTGPHITVHELAAEGLDQCPCGDCEGQRA